MMWLLVLFLGCKGPDDTGPVDTGELERCELDLDTEWTLGTAYLPFSAQLPGVAVVADKLVLAGGYYADPLVEEVYVGTTDEDGLLTGWDVLASIPEGSPPFNGRALPASSNRLVLYGGRSDTECRDELLWADFDGEHLGPWQVIGPLPEPVVDSTAIFTRVDRLLVFGGLSCTQSGEYGGGWATTFTGEGPSTWEPLPEIGSVADFSTVAATRRTLHLGGTFVDGEIITGPGFITTRLEDGMPVEWSAMRTPASAGMGNLTIAEGYLFTGPSMYLSGEHTGSGVLYSDANDPYDWYQLPDFPIETYSGSLVAYNGYLYLLGGDSGKGLFYRPICVEE